MTYRNINYRNCMKGKHYLKVSWFKDDGEHKSCYCGKNRKEPNEQ